jgi:leader peptidase (prepilin peptidase)/N-methyltransferase
MIYDFVLLFCLSLIAWLDWRTKKISGRILLFLLLVKSIFLVKIWILEPGGIRFDDALLLAGGGFLLGGGISFFCYLFRKSGLGGGDVKLFAVLGYYLGYGHILDVFFLSFLLAGSCGMILMICKKITRKQSLPLAPFVLAAVLCHMLRGG